MSFSAIIFSITTLIFALFTLKLKRVIEKEKILKKVLKKPKSFSNTPLAEHFFWTFFILMISFAIFSIDLIFFSSSRELMRAVKIFGDLILYCSFSYGISIPISLKFPKINRKKVVSILIFLSVLLATYQIFNYPVPPEVVGGIIFWNLDLLVIIVMFIFATAVWFPTGFVFLFNGLKNRKEFTKSLFLSLSFFMISGFSLLSLITKNQLFTAFSLILMAMGSVFLFLGMFYKPIHHNIKIYDRFKKSVKIFLNKATK